MCSDQIQLQKTEGRKIKTGLTTKDTPSYQKKGHEIKADEKSLRTGLSHLEIANEKALGTDHSIPL
jgi:hypothetical protein